MISGVSRAPECSNPVCSQSREPKLSSCKHVQEIDSESGNCVTCGEKVSPSWQERGKWQETQQSQLSECSGWSAGVCGPDCPGNPNREVPESQLAERERVHQSPLVEPTELQRFARKYPNVVANDLRTALTEREGFHAELQMHPSNSRLPAAVRLAGKRHCPMNETDTAHRFGDRSDTYPVAVNGNEASVPYYTTRISAEELVAGDLLVVDSCRSSVADRAGV